MNNERQNQWDASYERRENFVFAPNEQLVRFISRYVRRRTGLHQFHDLMNFPLRMLDLGCGIGRHVVFGQEMGIESYGVDLSPVAVETAREWIAEKGCAEAAKFIQVASATALPFPDKFFDIAVSHGVLDSMPFETARAATTECARVLKPGALFYCDLISADDSRHGREFSGEETVTTQHERDTVQSYFNFAKIHQLIEGTFQIVEAVLVRSENLMAVGSNARTHLVLKKN